MMKPKTFILPILFLALAPLKSWAASTDLGGTFNDIDVGTRAVGMGAAFVAVADDANAVYDNPAGMAFFDKDAHYATFTNSDLFGVSGLTRDFIAYAQADTLGFGAFGLSWDRLSADIDPDTWTEDDFSYAGAKALTHGDGPGFSVGWKLDYLRVDSSFSDTGDGLSVSGGNASGYSVGLSMMLKPRPSLNIGIDVDDLYSNLAWGTGTLEILDTTARAGLAYHLTEQALFSAEARAEQSSSGFGLSSWHLGGEYWLLDGKNLLWDVVRNIGIRAGYYQLLQNGDGGTATAGATLKADQWQIDYAYQFALSGQALGATNRFGLSVSF